jgi:hypothetical protein
LVGWPTVAAIYGQRLAPRLLDRYLARTGYRSQQTSERATPGRPDNLFHSVPGEFGAHGEFDSRAKAFSTHFLISYRLPAWLAALGVAAGVIAAMWAPPPSRFKSERNRPRAA